MNRESPVDKDLKRYDCICIKICHDDNFLKCKEPFTNDVRREGEGGGCPNSDAVREVA